MTFDTADGVDLISVVEGVMTECILSIGQLNTRL